MQSKMALTAIFLAVLATNGHAFYIDNSPAAVSPLANLDQFELQINQSVAFAIETIQNYHEFIQNASNEALDTHKQAIREKVTSFKERILKRRLSENDAISKCLAEEGQLDLLGETVNQQIQTCATVVLSEMVNVISDSVNEVQTFMSIPTKLGIDVQTCGLSKECLWKISSDAIGEAVQVPPKIFALAAKIQSITLRTVTSIDSCGLNGLKIIIDTGIGILEDIFTCISDAIE